MIISYHGCRQEDLAKLIAGQIEVSLGGGELERGFYTTLSLYLAKEWAWHQYKSLTVLKIAISDQDFYDLDPLILTSAQTHAYRRHIKTPGQTRAHLFHRNLIYAPIVGDRLGKGEEPFKWESNMVERLLNSNAVIRRSV